MHTFNKLGLCAVAIHSVAEELVLIVGLLFSCATSSAGQICSLALYWDPLAVGDTLQQVAAPIVGCPLVLMQNVIIKVRFLAYCLFNG